MNNLERLLKLEKEMEQNLKNLTEVQAEASANLKTLKTNAWEQFIDDLFAYSKYSRFLDTGVTMYNSSETVGFEVREDYICFISWKHEDRNGRRILPEKETYFFSITKDKPFAAKNGNSYVDRMFYVETVVKHWEEVKLELEKRLEKAIEIRMRNKMAEVKQTQAYLDKEIASYS